MSSLSTERMRCERFRLPCSSGLTSAYIHSIVTVGNWSRNVHVGFRIVQESIGGIAWPTS